MAAPCLLWKESDNRTMHADYNPKLNVSLQMPGQNSPQQPDLQILKKADQIEQGFFHFT